MLWTDLSNPVSPDHVTFSSGPRALKLPFGDAALLVPSLGGDSFLGCPNLVPEGVLTHVCSVPLK